MYNLNKSSKTSRFYTWIWGTDVTSFKTMCPYFWKYTFTILFLPFILLTKGLFYLMPAKKQIAQGLDYVADSTMGQKVGKALDKIGSYTKFWYNVGKFFKWFFIVFAVIIMIIVIVMLGVAATSEPIIFLTIIGGMTLFLLIIIGLMNLFIETNFLSSVAKPFVFVGEQVSNLYHQICPLITWK